MINDFGLNRTTVGEVSMLRISGFKNQEEVIEYIRKIHHPDGYAHEWGQLVITVPISGENYSTLMKGKSLDEYMTFFEDHFTKGNEKLIALWRLKQAEEMEELEDSMEEKILPEIDEEAFDETDIVLPDDSIETTLPIDDDQTDSQDSSFEYINTTSDDILDSANMLYNTAFNTVNDMTNKFNEFASDPIRGFLNLFKRDKKNNKIDEFAKQQEKEEKERQKQLKKLQREKNKAAMIEALLKEREEKELIKKKENEEKAAAKAKQQQQKDLAKQKEAEKKQKENEKKQKEAERKRLAKEKEKERKEKEKARKEEQKRKDKEREELRKQRERERKERLEQQKKQAKK